MINKSKPKKRIRKTREYNKPDADMALVKRPCMICKVVVELEHNMRLCPECREKVSTMNSKMF